MIESSDVFQVLAHVDFPRRYWPGGSERYVEKDYEEEYRAVFRALAGTGRALEVNTSSPLASVDQVRWFHEEGGEAVSFGSDAHAAGARSASASTSPSTSWRRPASGRAATGSTSGADELRSATPPRTTPGPARRSTPRTSPTR